MRFAYNTNGRPTTGSPTRSHLIADCGYDGVALTLDHHHLDPFAEDAARQAERRTGAAATGSASAGGRDRRALPARPARQARADAGHRARRGPGAPAVDFLRRAATSAERARRRGGVLLGRGAASPASTAPRPAAGCVDGVARRWSTRTAAGRTPRPWSRSPACWSRTATTGRRSRATSTASRSRSTPATASSAGRTRPTRRSASSRPHLGTVAIEDMRRGVHEHLPFGEGDMDIPACSARWTTSASTGWSCVELSRESHRADQLVPALASPTLRSRAREDLLRQPPLLPRDLRHERLRREPAARARRRRPRRHHGQPVPRRRGRHAVYGGGPPPPSVPGGVARHRPAEPRGDRRAGRFRARRATTWSTPSCSSTPSSPSTCCTPSTATRPAGRCCWRRARSGCPPWSPSRAATATGSAPAARRTGGDPACSTTRARC